jgi:hypothetical protein
VLDREDGEAEDEMETKETKIFEVEFEGLS